VYSLAGFPVGAYILDVIVDLGSGKKGAYETILVILEKEQQPVQPAQIINKFIFDNGDNNTNGNQTYPGDGCELGFVLVGDNCEPETIICKLAEGCPDPPVEPPVIDGNETVIPEEPIGRARISRRDTTRRTRSTRRKWRIGWSTTFLVDSLNLFDKENKTK